MRQQQQPAGGGADGAAAELQQRCGGQELKRLHFGGQGWVSSEGGVPAAGPLTCAHAITPCAHAISSTPPPPAMHCRVSELEAALAAADAERASQRQQLARLKQQMLSEQEDEEDKIR